MGSRSPTDRLGQAGVGEAVPLLIDQPDQCVEVVHPVRCDQQVDRLGQRWIVELADAFEEAMADADGAVGGIGPGEQLVLRGEHRRQARLERMAAQDGQAIGMDGADEHLLDGRHEVEGQASAQLVDQVARSALGEGDRHDALRGATRLERVAQPADERLGLAGTCPGRDGDRPADLRSCASAFVVVGELIEPECELALGHGSPVVSVVSSSGAAASMPAWANHWPSRWFVSSAPSASGEHTSHPHVPTSPGRNSPSRMWVTI